MNSEMQATIFRAMLGNLNRGKSTVTVADIKGAVTEGEYPSFLLDEALTQLSKDGIISKTGHDQFNITVDIGTLRSYILNCDKQKKKTGGDNTADIRTILESRWTLREPRQADDSGGFKFTDEDADSPGNDPFGNIERRYRKLWGRITENNEELEADEDDDDEWETNREKEAAEDEKLKRQALKFCVEKNMASVSLIQRNFPIGYIKSCKIVDWMEENCFVSATDGSKPRKVLISMEEFEALFGRDAEADEEEAEEKDSQDNSASDRYLKRRANEYEKRNAAQNLVNVLTRVAEKKSTPVTCEEAPGWSLWEDNAFEEAVVERLEKIIKSDRRMGRQGAIKKAETYLEAVRDTHDRKMVQVYERIVYEFKCVSDYVYGQLKRRYFE